MAIKKGLGRGLDMLIPKEESSKITEEKSEKAEQKKENSPEQPKPTQTTNKKHNRR